MAGRAGRSKFLCHLLNMGRTKFGDCIVVQCAGQTILIDGGHPGDDKERDDRPTIPAQLADIFGHEAPFHVDLLIVTHCHQDHIGCLPKLIAGHVVTCDRALVADENLGFGLDASGEGDARVAGSNSRVRQLIAALSEEDHSDLRGDDLAQFLSDAASLQDNYTTMLQTLARDADLVRYRQGNAGERAAVAGIEKAFEASGLTIFGPTADQLVHCAQTIQSGAGDAADFIADHLGDPSESIAESYRRIVASGADAAAFDRRIGWAKNCQSIVLALGAPDARILLPGDMQFAEPGIPEIADFVQKLRADVAAGGPYVFVKTPHHTSHNGIDKDVIAEWGWPPLLGHSGGYNDVDHPYPATLSLLKSLRRQHDFTYARTDHNGRVTVLPAAETITGEKSRLNDFTPNPGKDAIVETPVPQPEASPVKPAAAIGETSAARSGDVVEVTFLRIPYGDGRVAIDGHVIEITRSGVAYASAGAPAPSADPQPTGETAPPPRRPPLRLDPAPPIKRLAANRDLPPLLFVTDPERLQRNIGGDADRAIAIVKEAGHRLVTGAGDTLAETTRRALLDGNVKGVVLLGGYDVVPSQRVDVLDPQLRASMPPDLIGRDRDGFVVWSDDIYGDREPDGVPEVPVSRIPDARVGAFLLSALTVGATGQAGKFAIRNRERPFAQAVYASIPGNGVMQVSGAQRVDVLQR